MTALPSAADIAESVRAGVLTAAQVVAASLDRIAELDGSIGAFQVVDAARARAAAAALDARLLSLPEAERSSLPLAGVPVAV